MAEYIAIDELNPNLAARYRKTAEYRKQGLRYAIIDIHPLVREAEEKGLNDVMVFMVLNHLQSKQTLLETLEKRAYADWKDEWLTAQSKLFHFLYKDHLKDDIRTTAVRFGAPGEEDDIYKIPKTKVEIEIRLRELTEYLKYKINNINANNIDDVCYFLGKVHLDFICIHPFIDGNGRIARALVDQLAVAMGFPPIVVGFPRTNEQKKQDYHSAIRESAKDKTKSYQAMSLWIKVQLEDKIRSIA